MEINEIFSSIQGEGPNIGKPSLFVRLSGCNQNCHFCDSKFHVNCDLMLSEETIINEIKKHNIKNIVFTGGEPLLQQEAIRNFLFKYYPDLFGIDIEIETNGSIFVDRYGLGMMIEKKIYNFHFNISPKLKSSGNDSHKINKHYVKLLRKINVNNFSYCFKFVFNYDSKEILDFIYDYDIDRNKIYIMPEGMSKLEQQEKMNDVIEFCKKNNFIFSPRLHVLVWDTKKGV